MVSVSYTHLDVYKRQGVLCSIIGTFLVKTKEDADQKYLLNALGRGTNLSAITVAVVSFFVVRLLLGLSLIHI